MTAKENKLLKLTLGQMVLINTVVIIVFMTVNSFVCTNNLIDGECIKRLDNRMAAFQMIVNLLFAGYLIKRDKGKLRILLLNLFFTSIIYFIAGTLHSISKTGLF